jgi:hypothetical protein
LSKPVLQFLLGRVPEAGTGERQVDPDRDAIVLCTDPAAPATVRIQLASAVQRVASQPPGTGFGTELTKPQHAALKIALDHVRRAWKAANQSEPSNEDLRSFFRTLRVLTLDLEEGRSDQQAALTALHRALPDNSRAPTAWTVLGAEGHASAETREWRDRPMLGVALSRKDVALAAPKMHAADVTVLRERSAANLRKMQAEARLPVVAGGLYISRSVSEKLRTATSRENVLIIGDAGSGKSAVAQDLATSRSTEEVVVLLARDLVGINQLRTNAPIQEVFRAWAGPPGLIAIDGVDALRGSDDRETLSCIVSALAGTRWQVVATARTFDTRYSQPLRRAFPGSPLTQVPNMFDERLADVRHLLVSDLTDDELDRAITAPMTLASVIAEASPDLRTLLRNPFNLRLAADLSDGLTSGQRAELLQVRSRVELLRHYWDRRIRSHDRLAREALLTRLSVDMVKRRSLQTAEEEPTVVGTDSTALEDLLSQNVLSALDGAIQGVGRVLAFTHNILFDYAAAIYVLYHPTDLGGLTGQLDADPTLPLVARPSFDLLVDMLWDKRSAGHFWPRVLLVAGSQHDLASLAIASRIANLVRAADDLLELAPKSGEANTETALLPRQKLAGQIIGAVRAQTVVPSMSSAVLPLATLAHRLASNASNASNASYSHADAALAVDVTRALQGRIPIADEDPPQPGRDERANVIAALLDGCRSDPRKMEHIAGAAARQLKYVIGFSPEVRQSVRRLIDDQPALKQWGGTVLTWFPEAAAAALNQDPQLARILATVATTFEEERDEQVSFGGSAIVGMNESRKQQAGRAVHELGEIFFDFCERDIITSTEIVCDLLTDDDQPPEPYKWPITAHGRTGYIENGYGLSLRPHTNEDEQKMLTALSTALLTASAEDADEAVGILVDRMHSAFGWAALIDQPSDPAGLGRILFAGLESGAMLAHPDTFPRAAALLVAVVKSGGAPAAQIEAAVRNAIELAGRSGAGDYVKSVLVGCLGNSEVSDSELARRREGLGDSAPEIPTPLSIQSDSTPWSVVDHLQTQGIGLSDEVESTARTLACAINEAQSGSATPDAVDGLITAFMAATEVFAEAQALHPRLELLLVSAAARLAHVATARPDSPHGTRVLRVLNDAAEHPDAGLFSR